MFSSFSLFGWFVCLNRTLGPRNMKKQKKNFLKRYAKVDEALENGSAIEEGDDEDQELELEIGNLFAVCIWEHVLNLLFIKHASPM